MSENITHRIKITGLVQGVGFRPFVYRIATEYNIKGTVDNRNDGVLIFASAPKEQQELFLEALRNRAPRASQIHNIQSEKVDFQDFNTFSIVKSKNNAIKDEITEVSPDIAICEDCLEDMKKQKHRLDYPFINCTHCGPRFSIIKSLPYDRPKTTMDIFPMCPICKQEYTSVEDRRFHAQPVACNHCGPQYTLHHQGGKWQNIHEILSKISIWLKEGEVLLVKGLGGYNLVCNARNEKAVEKLRNLKHRDGKPLAVMFKDLKSIENYRKLSPKEKEVLNSWRRPIVLLQQVDFQQELLSSRFNSLGAMLPYMPFHYLLFDQIHCDALVYTSANLSGEPIIVDNSEALKAFGKKIPVLTYNREIYNRVDDSVAIIMDEKTRMIRRSRSYAPAPIRTSFSVDGILAVGAELVNCFCIGRTQQAILSQHIGDLKNAETLAFYEESIQRFSNLYAFQPKLVVSDLHPDYISSRYADGLPIQSLKVQHHHAHMASVMAEHHLDEKVIGIIMDGTGYGLDGNIWGGEFFIGDYMDFQREAHFEYLPIPGGDQAVKEPWKIALSFLYQKYGKAALDLEIPFIDHLDSSKAGFILQMLEKKIASPLSSSAGRLFDAVSALLELCTKSSFHAEAPMRLENEIGQNNHEDFYSISNHHGIIKTTDLLEEIVHDLILKKDKSYIAAKFHNSLINCSIEVCKNIQTKHHLNKVVLSGGSFQNAYFSTRIERRLKALGFEVFVHEQVPANDGGLALGQLAIGAKQHSKLKDNIY